ncbi:glycosyltransferase family 2 protein [Cupriavidus plantarum]|uniref:glycosyltransferase family 2 protein n=1 Tax=Cupriavidus plantarum TaxID=942865 RepID=UPI000E3AC29F|nr:glycosyltransferase family 2 protein [Cupriavidus plantarum]REF01828.1 glycosyltransferase involved in cell wall biosynthesis [Cupriavidus plantarum]RLK45312.1 glycosyltransferase involved in cell wall biosynthesis [Cupriavidus plantarum]
MTDATMTHAKPSGTADFRPVVLVPVFNHERAIGAMVDAILRHPVPCLLIDDGSSERCAAVLRDLAATHADRVTLIRLDRNQGKGAAVMAGFDAALRAGYTHALQIDADGQHDAGCIPAFFDVAQRHPDAIVCGTPVYDASVPRGRLIGRYVTHVWVWIHTLSFAIRDSMCGLRVYPLASVVPLVRTQRIGHRMEFDTEVIVHLVWRGAPVLNIATPVTYPIDGVSHFRMWRDNVRISWMHTRLFFGMLGRLPTLVARKLARKLA